MSSSVILKYTLKINSMDDGPVKQPLAKELDRMPSGWYGYLMEAAENLSDLLPDGLFVTIEQPREE